MKKTKNDRALRFYNEVLDMERLHYGIWLPEDELTVDKFKIAQQRYEDYLIENIPDDAKSVLDVGCGTGAMSANLKKAGYDVEGLSPDINQQKIFSKKVNAEFHFCCFEDFTPSKKYDCIIMSESCQYIPLDLIFKVAAKALKKDGTLIICDYFVLNHSSGILAKSGHNYQQFINKAKSENFEITKDEDITNNVTKTLDLSLMYVEKVLLSVEIATEKFVAGHPYVTRFILWLFRKKINSSKQEKQLLDSKKFKENKQYRFILMKLK